MLKVNLNKQLTQNFKLSEFLTSKFYDKENQKKVLESVTYPILENIHELADNLQIIRDEVNAPIHINIAFRPLWWEHKQGRSGNSQHTKGKAADIVVDGLRPIEVAEVIEDLIQQGCISEGGLSDYSTFCHYDVRDYNARW